VLFELGDRHVLLLELFVGFNVLVGDLFVLFVEFGVELFESFRVLLL
jgi:hypothetical protein